jgi:hypothetical protein
LPVPEEVVHTWPSPMQRPARQQPLALHWLLAQQVWPGLPHTTQMLLWQSVPAPQGVAPGQQDSPGPPQPTQVPLTVPPTLVLEQRVPGSLHEVPQQVCPLLPQPEQRPAMQVPPPLAIGPQAEPLGTQVPV